MRKSLAAIIVGVVVVAAVLAAVPAVERHAALEIKREIERRGAVKVDAVEVGLFGRRLKLSNLRTVAAAEISIGRLEASGLAWPLAELLRGRTPLAGFRWGDPLSADRIELENVQVVDPVGGSRLGLDALLVDRLDLSRYDGEAEGPDRARMLAARVLAALSVGRLEQRSTVFTFSQDNRRDDIASIVVERYEHGRIASMTLDGLTVMARNGQPGLVSLADIKVAGLDIGRVLAALSSEVWFPGAPVGRVHLDNFIITGFGGELLKRYGISLAGIDFAAVQEGDKLLRSRARVEGFVLAPPLRGLEGLALRLALQSMGLKEIKADFDCSGSEDRAKGEVVVQRCALVGPGLGEIDLSVRMVGADADYWQALDDGDMVGVFSSGIGLAAARLVLADKSLLERGLRAMATTTGQPLTAVRANLAREVRRYQPTGVLISQAMTQLLDTVARFVEQGGTLTIDAKPEQPVGFDRLEYLTSPGADLVSVLGLTATLSK
ncbi:MAG: hypothetical protein FJX11_20550 [Alphaproteobacteria bacterium]|nr:hypothetical protein [Alphaproteobacteria bacterium]